MNNITLKELLECRMLMTSQSLEIRKIDVIIEKIINDLCPEDKPAVKRKAKD